MYLALTKSREELLQLRVTEFCPTRKKKGKQPTITGNGTLPLGERWKIWNKGEKVPNQEERKKMVCHALGVAMKTTWNNHIFIAGIAARERGIQKGKGKVL